MRVTRHPDLLEDVLQPNSMMPDTDVGVAWLLISSPRISPPHQKGATCQAMHVNAHAIRGVCSLPPSSFPSRGPAPGTTPRLPPPLPRRDCLRRKVTKLFITA